MIYGDGVHVGFLSRYPTLRGYALVVPRRHVEDVVRDLTPDEYLALQSAVHTVARAIGQIVQPERTYARGDRRTRRRHPGWNRRTPVLGFGYDRVGCGD
jgi:HIT domain